MGKNANRMGCILDVVDPVLDPVHLCKLFIKAAEPQICHCAPAEQARLGGMEPVINRDAGKVVCRTCQREIGPGCRCRHVNHPRGLIALDQKYPENVDCQDIEAAGWLLQISEWVMCCQQRQEE